MGVPPFRSVLRPDAEVVREDLRRDRRRGESDHAVSPVPTLPRRAECIGVSPASDVRRKVSPPFTSLETFFKPGMMSSHFAEVNETFNGEVHFPTLNPGNSYIWFLGRVPELFQDDSGIPRRWEVETEYTGTASPEPFRETFVLDLDVEKRIELPVDPLVRIGKDIEVVGSHLKAIKGVVPRELTLSDDSVKALSSNHGIRSSAVRARRAPSWLRRRR
jgi:hypothetical protein